MQNIIVSDFPSCIQSSVRVSLACVQCRSRHIKCDARTPVCSRCKVKGEQCVYQKSRRGGRRTRKSHQSENNKQHFVPSAPPLVDISIDSLIHESGGTTKTTDSSPSCPVSVTPAISGYASGSGDSISVESDQGTSIVNEKITCLEDVDDLLDSYYTHFHPAHPCVLPRLFFKQRLERDSISLKPVLLVMRYIGSLYMSSASSASLEVLVQDALAKDQITMDKLNGYHVQSLILYSIAVYWCGETDRGLNLLNEAILRAIDLGMNLQGFSVQYGCGDPVLEESWRRTWWLIYVTDAHFAGSTHTYPFRTTNVVMSVDLPSEEESYILGNIPRPRTLPEYDMREFAEDDSTEFSSFAHLIGLTRSLDTVFSRGRETDLEFASTLAANFDASIMGWSSLLRSKRRLLRIDGTMDELLLRANMIVNACIVDIHRPLSNLMYCSVESVSRCAPPPPIRTASTDVALSEVHTSKILRGIEALNGLLTISASLKSHTPFVICIIANTTIAYLSACKHVLRDQALKLAREKIRLRMGVIKALGEFWPFAREIYRQVGVIAREILCLDQEVVLPVGTSPSDSLIRDLDSLVFNLDYPSLDFINLQDVDLMNLCGSTL